MKSKMAGKTKPVEPHILHPYQPGSVVLKEYQTVKYFNGSKQTCTLLDYEYKNKKGKKVQVEGYVLLVKTERTKYTQLNTSDLNNMSELDISLHQEEILKWEPEFYSEPYFSWVSSVLTRRLKLKIQNKPYYYDLKDLKDV